MTTIGNVISLTMRADKMPTLADVGFVCDKPISKADYIAKRHRENMKQTIGRGLTTVGGGALSMAVTKGLMVMGDRTGKRGYYAAAAILSTATTVAAAVATSKNIDHAMRACSQIGSDSKFLPDMLREWKSVPSDDCIVFEAKMASLNYDPEKDGPMTIEELIDKRTEQVCEKLEKADMIYAEDEIRELIANEQFSTVHGMVIAADTIIHKSEMNDKLYKQLHPQADDPDPESTDLDVAQSIAATGAAYGVEGCEPQVEGRDLPKYPESGEGPMEQPIY